MITILESNATELKRLEGIIAKGMKTFVAVGNALKEIRDSKLYRASHGTFERYCKDRWDISRPRAYELIESAGVAENLSGMPDKPQNARQSTELAKAPPEQQAEVWQEVTESTAKPTAAAVKAAVERRREPVKTEIVDDETEMDIDPGPASAPPPSPIPARPAMRTVDSKILELLPASEQRLVIARGLFDCMEDWQRDHLPMLWDQWRSSKS